ncbi:unnamed protein product [Amoebophrya sp. A25]|nr:unnamed protein product [Amoebophrya sp. A25]|eukprot:GSA25T00025933001.1
MSMSSSIQYREFFLKEAVRTGTVSRPDVTNALVKNKLLQELKHTVLDDDSLRIVCGYMDAMPETSNMIPLASELAATSKARLEKAIAKSLGPLLKAASESGESELILTRAAYMHRLKAENCTIRSLDRLEDFLSKYGYECKVDGNDFIRISWRHAKKQRKSWWTRNFIIEMREQDYPSHSILSYLVSAVLLSLMFLLSHLNMFL